MPQRLLSAQTGNMSVIMMGVMATLALIVGGVIDYASLGNEKRSLQSVADGAALAAAREMVIVKATDVRVQSIAESYVKANFKSGEAATKAEIVENGRAVKVSVSADPQVYFPGPIGLNATTVHAEATAEISGGGNVCMIGLDPDAPMTLNMMNNARLTAPDCAVYSNSFSKKSLNVANFARVNAKLTCVTGGVGGAKAAVTPLAIEDCPPIADPLKDHVDPKYGLLKCDYLAPVTVVGNVTLKPGVYCAGITVAAFGKVTLEPGIYTMNTGGLSVIANGALEGENVGFYLTGANATIMFGPNSHISLTAPKTGPLAGILFFEDRDVLLGSYHQISSNDARRLVGTMYFPKSRLKIDANNPVADRSEYTVIIARGFDLSSGPELVLKTDYDASPIPLPEGVGNKARPEIRLSK
jgi:Flp pilus assembly protein TadG